MLICPENIGAQSEIFRLFTYRPIATTHIFSKGFYLRLISYQVTNFFALIGGIKFHYSFYNIIVGDLPLGHFWKFFSGTEPAKPARVTVGDVNSKFVFSHVRTPLTDTLVQNWSLNNGIVLFQLRLPIFVNDLRISLPHRCMVHSKKAIGELLLAGWLIHS